MSIGLGVCQRGIEYIYLWLSKKSDDHSMVPFDERATVNSDSVCIHTTAMARIDLRGLLRPCILIVDLNRVSGISQMKF